MALLDKPLSYEEIIEEAKDEVDPDWDSKALDDGKSVVKSRSYEVIAVSRSGTTFHEPVTRIRYRPQANSAKNFSVKIEPNSVIEEKEFLGGEIALFVDREPLQVGYIESIDINQNDEDYEINARPLATKLEEENVNKMVENEMVDDLLAKTIDEYNTVVGSHDDATGTERESTEGLIRFADDILRVDDEYGNVKYKIFGDASQLDLINVKVSSPHKVDVWIDVDSFEYHEVLDDLDTSEYGEWRELEVPDLPSSSNFDLWFELQGGSILYDWNILTDVVLTRDVDVASVETVQRDEAILYERTGEQLKNNVAEEENDEGEMVPKTNNVYWDDERKKYRLKQARAHYSVIDPTNATGGDIGSGENDDRYVLFDEGATYHRSLGLPPGEFYTFDLNPDIEDEFEEWAIMWRVRCSDDTTSSDQARFSVGYKGDRVGVFMVGPSDDDYNGPHDEFYWKPGGYHEQFGNPTFSAEYDPESGTDERLSFIMPTDNTTDIILDYVSVFRITKSAEQHVREHRKYNNVTQSDPHLNGPPLYLSGSVEFQPFESADNITEARTYIDPLPVEPIGDSGPRHRTDSNAEYLPSLPLNSPSVETRFPYPGANHQVKVHMAPSGTNSRNTPKKGFNPQPLEGYKVRANTNDLQIFGKYEVEGNRLEVLSDIADDSNYFFRFDGKEAQIFKRGSREAKVDLLQEETNSTYSIENVYSDVHVIGDGVEATAEAPNPPDFINRTKTIYDPSITSRTDARRKAVSFIVKNSNIRYSGDITTLPTPVPVGEVIDGSHFKHGEDMIIQDARYSKSKTSISCGFEKKFSDQMIHLSRATRNERKRSTGSDNQ